MAATTIVSVFAHEVEILRNGSLLIERYPLHDGHAIVLAKTRSDSSQYATWHEYRHPGQAPFTGNGHYFDNIVDAAADFSTRCQRGY